MHTHQGAWQVQKCSMHAHTHVHTHARTCTHVHTHLVGQICSQPQTAIGTPSTQEQHKSLMSVKGAGASSSRLPAASATPLTSTLTLWTMSRGTSPFGYARPAKQQLQGVLACSLLAGTPHHTTPHLTPLHLTTPHHTTPHLTPLHLTTPHPTAPHLTSPHCTSPHPTHPTAPHHTTPPHCTSPHLTPLHLTPSHPPPTDGSPYVHQQLVAHGAEVV